uniref:tRNA-2-methylthio-N(6)-dimethylallyladenosine synthase n=1 Tax=Candidatus Methanogaster sp. ANME-2c ERB4 TaxID=2759911 RepID=A0A7G9YE76_9EURY|nr:tRNA-2-methylthio-N(6)-dimethylallyladenosine synthase [Methanosarcinales archaeon ANME-2c ERB4]
MKIYLLNPPYFPHFGRGMRWQDTGRGGTLYYPVWLSYAAAVVEQEHEIRLVDAPAWEWGREDVIKDAARFDPDLIVLDSSFPSLNNDISVAESLKEHLDCKIVLVGPPASQFPDEILKSGVDIVARWECDFTISEIADTISEGGSMDCVEGISYREDGIVKHNPDRPFTSSEDLDKIPFVSKVYKKHLNIKDYFLGSSLYPEVQIFTGRGCPFRCTFCSWPQTLMGRKYRVRSISNLLDELEWIQDNLDVKEVFFEDDTFTISEKRVLEFCREYKDRCLDVTWACNARVSLDYETMREMKNAHCRLMIAGYESGSDEILTNVKKGSTVDEAREFARNARKSGLLVHGDFIIGLPGETKETMEMTRKLIKEVRADILQVSVASPFPGTEFYEWCKENGYLLTDDPNEYLDSEGHQKAIISYPWLTAEEITSMVDGILKGYYLSLNYVPLAARQVMRRQGIDEMRRLWYSVKMFTRYIADR